MTAKWISELIENENGVSKLLFERTMMEVTELICKDMERNKVTKSNLAKMLNKSESYVTQLLDGNINLTLKELSEIMALLGRQIVLDSTEIRKMV